MRVPKIRPPRSTSCQVMGIVNVTPDSFFEESRSVGVEAAVARAEAMIDAGADIIDIGGESTRPGAIPVPNGEEIARVVPVIEAIADRVDVSIDTRHAEVAVEAVRAGASIINDVSASLEEVAAQTGAGWVAMHMRGTPQSMQVNPRYEDVVSDVLAYVVEAGERARRAGVERIWIDPGIGFGKTAEHNLALMASLDRFVGTGFPLLVGVSRKRFVGVAHAEADLGPGFAKNPSSATEREPLPANERIEGSLALATWAFMQNASIVRVHDVAETLRCCAVVLKNPPTHIQPT